MPRCKWNEQILEEGCLEVAQIGELLEWEASDNGIAFITAEEFYQGFPHEPMSGPKAALLPITWEKALAFGGLEEGEMKEKMKKCADFICRFGVRITVPTRDPRSNEVFPKETVMISVARTKRSGQAQRRRTAARTKWPINHHRHSHGEQNGVA